MIPEQEMDGHVFLKHRPKILVDCLAIEEVVGAE